MNLKRSTFALKNKISRSLENKTNYPTITDLIREQKISNNEPKTVHHRRDLDSLG